MKKAIAVLDKWVNLEVGNLSYWFYRNDIEFYFIGLDDLLCNRYCKSNVVPFGDCIDYEPYFDLESFEREQYDVLVCHMYLALSGEKIKPFEIEQL
mgnify:CR=1 FL=1